jgi:transposase InsO family protein
MCRQTASKYTAEGKLPSELKETRTWRTRKDPFKEVWVEIEQLLKESPGLKAASIYEELDERYPGRFPEGQLRSLQRRIRKWRALYEDHSSQDIFFPQRHRPGEAAQTDFTYTGELGITVCGQEYKPLLCHVTLPFSNWEWATTCKSESFLALQHGIQEAFYRLGRVPEWHQTDNSTSATHQVSKGGRKFIDDYEDFMKHVGMKPRTIAVGKKEQNGTVEAKNGALKRYLAQRLLLRGNADFETEAQFETFLRKCLQKANAKRQDRLKEELAVMSPLSVPRFPEFTEQTVRVSRNSTINVRQNIYSMPPRLVGHEIRARIYEKRIEVFYGDVKIQEMP